jgi:hypothetical protein
MTQSAIDFGNPRMITLLYELIDAHEDTTRLASALTVEPTWAAHLDYLRALQRTAREALAHAPARA